LVTAGDQDQLSAIDRVVDRLHETVHIHSEAAAVGLEVMEKTNEGLQWIMQFGAEQEDLKGQVERVHAHVAELEQRLAEKSREVEELRSQHEAGTQHRERLLLETEQLRNQLREKDNTIAELEKKAGRAERR
jgi:predicted RNase H-like nuclease (RuvC/YqgF family)